MRKCGPFPVADVINLRVFAVILGQHVRIKNFRKSLVTFEADNGNKTLMSGSSLLHLAGL